MPNIGNATLTFISNKLFSIRKLCGKLMFSSTAFSRVDHTVHLVSVSGVKWSFWEWWESDCNVSRVRWSHDHLPLPLIRSGDWNLQDWKMTDHQKTGWILQDWKMTDEVAGVEIAGLENDGRTRRRGICKTGKRRTGKWRSSTRANVYTAYKEKL